MKLTTIMKYYQCTNNSYGKRTLASNQLITLVARCMIRFN